MSDARGPRLGQVVRWDGHPWKVERLHDGGLDLRNLMTGELQTWSLASWMAGWQRGELKLPTAPEPLDRRRPNRGAYMRRKGATWRVKTVKGGLIHLENVATDETDAVSLEDWQAECWRGETEMADSPDEQVPERIRELLRIPLDGLPASMRAAVDRSSVFVDAYRNPERFYRERMPDLPEAERVPLNGRLSKPRVDPFLRHVAAATGLPKPGFSTFCKWLKKMRLAGGDIRAVAPRFDRRGPHERRMPALVEQWLVEAITEVWLTREENRKAKVWDRLEARVRAWNGANPDASLWCPSRGHVARYIREEVDRHVAARQRKGKKAADREHRPPGDGVVTTRPLERVEVDHTRLRRVRAVDDKDGGDLGGVWVTIAHDHFTRMPLAVLVHFDGETLGAVFSCLRMTMTPKGFLRKLVPNLDYAFPTGVPESFFFDRAKASDTDHVRRVGLVLGLIVDYAEGKNPQLKGSLERFIRTLKDETQRPTVGPNPPDHRDDRDDDRPDFFIRYSVLVRRIWTWVAMVYAKSWHSGIDDVPLRRWQEHTARRLPRALRSQDDLAALLTRKVSCLPLRGTVTAEGLTWKGEAIRQITAHPSYRKGMRVDVFFDDYDVSEAWVVNPFTGAIVKLEPAQAFMVGLTLHQHDRVLKRNGRLERAYTTAELRDQKAAMMEEADRLLRESGRLSAQARAQVSRFKGKGQNQPAGEDTGEVAPHPDAAGPDAGPDAPSAPPGEADEGRSSRPRRPSRRLRGDHGE